MRRAHVAPAVLDAVQDGALALPSDAAHRFGRVLRLADGERVELFDGAGRIARGTLAGSRLVDVVVESAPEPLPPLVVAQASVPTDKLELVVQKATELGASEILVFDAARSQARVSGDRLEKRQARLQRIADDAARQCGRARPPTIAHAPGTAAVAARVKALVGAGAVAAVGAVDASAPLSEVLAGAALDAGALIVVGPEGGLAPDEIARLIEAGAHAVRLGAHVLRTETAALVALAAMQARLGHL